MCHLSAIALLFIGIFGSSQVLAACEQPRNVQQIDIRQINGTIAVQHKNQIRRCQVNNNQLDDENQASRVVWVFHNLNCQPGECLVELKDQPALTDKALKCDLGSNESRKCRLNVNRLKKYCDTSGGNDPEQCEFSYDIKVRDVVVDPSIIIRPRPALSD